MKIKVTFFILLSLLSCQQIFSQCKLDKKKDDFTSEESITTKDVTIAYVFPILQGDKKPWNVDMCFISIDSIIGFILTHQSQGWSTEIDAVYFKLDNGTVIKKEDRFSEGEYSTGGAYTFKFSRFKLTKEELTNFSNNKIEKVRIVFAYFPDYPVYEKELKDKKNMALKEVASCLLKELK